MSDDQRETLPGSKGRIVNNVEGNQFEWGEGTHRAILTYRVRGMSSSTGTRFALSFLQETDRSVYNHVKISLHRRPCGEPACR